MNKEMFLRVADAIEKEQLEDGKPFRFEMSDWVRRYSNPSINNHGNFCGTAACVAGTAVLLKHGDNLHTEGRHYFTLNGREKLFEYQDEGTRIMGLERRAAEHLFGEVELANANRRYVPDALRWMAESGRVDWKKGFEYAQCVEKEKQTA
jgi:hypothetical protein